MREKLLKMRAADKRALVNTFNGTHALARAALRALVVIDYGKIVYKAYSAHRAGLYALTARDTAVYAEFTHVCALFVVVTLNNNALRILYQVDNAVGAHINADAAAYTLGGIYVGNAVLAYADSRAGARLYTVAVAKARKGAKSIA